MVLVSAPLATGGSARASCAAPELEVAGTLVPGVQVEVTGRGFVEGCDDTGGTTTGPGCTARQEREAVRPREQVALVLEQGSRRWRLGAVDAGTAADGMLGRVSWQVEVPREVRPGPARLVTRDAELRVRVSPRG